MAKKAEVKVTTSSKDKVEILSCSCSNSFQDETYGKGKRVHNPCKSEKGGNFRCTVCSTKR